VIDDFLHSIASIFNPIAAQTPLPKRLHEFHRAIENGLMSEVANFLVKYPKAIDMPGHYGMTAMMHAARGKGANAGDIMDLLIAKGADINQRDESGQTALFHVDNTRQIELLVARGADLEAVDNDGETTLMRFAGGGRDDVTAAMIAHGAKIHAVDKSGRTALLHAAHHGSFECALLLIRHGADVHHVDNDGRTALHLAAMIDGPGHDRAEKGFRRTVRRLLREGAKINVIDKEGKTPLHHALGTEMPRSEEDYLEMIKLLLDAGANRDIADAKKITPMALAYEMENEELLKIMNDGYKRPPPTAQRDIPFRPPEMP